MREKRVAGVGPAIVGMLGLSALVTTSAHGYTVVEVTDAGSVSGVVKFAGEYPQRETVRIDKDHATCGMRHDSEEYLVDPESKGLRNVVAILEGVEAGKPIPDVEVALDQAGCRYEPHVQIGYASGVPSDDVELIILNSDDVFHNVHAYEGVEATQTVFNTPSIPEEELVEAIDGPGVYSIECDVHAWMQAWIVIVAHPYAALSDEKGTFSIAGVPPGSYTLRLWHEGLGEVERPVEVTPGADFFVDFTIGE